MWGCICSRHEGPSRTLSPMLAGQAWESPQPTGQQACRYQVSVRASTDTSMGPLMRVQRLCKQALEQALEAEELPPPKESRPYGCKPSSLYIRSSRAGSMSGWAVSIASVLPVVLEPGHDCS